MSEEICYAYRPAPCPAYDVEGTESWLSDLSAEGLFLSSDGFFCGIGIFERRAPHRLTYRLEAAERPAGVMGGDAPPADEIVDISASMGWQYISRRGNFYIYAAESPAVREPNTDPAVQAMALAHLSRRVRSSVVNLIVELLLWCVLFPFFRGGGQIFIAAINIGTWFWLWGHLLLAWFIIDSCRQGIYLRRLRKRLLADGYLDHAKDWRADAMRHYLFRMAKILAVAAWIIVLLVRLNHGILGTYEISIDDYEDDPPFATMIDLAPEGDYTRESMFGDMGNSVRVWSDWLAPVNYAWDEVAYIRDGEMTVLSGGLYIDYHETAAPWIAHALAKEYHRVERWELRGDYALLEVDLPDIDYAVAFLDSIHMPTVVLQKGTRIIHATFHQHSDAAEIPLAEWAARMAECLN